MAADTSAKVGFRPYRHTDPFGAAHLSGLGADLSEGLGVYHLNRVFDPWELYDDVHHTAGTRRGLHGLEGLGQNHPFKPQAWHLHGVPLEDAVPEIVDRVHEAVDRGDHATAQALVNTLNGLGSAPDQTTVDELVANGYNPLDISQVIAQGASSEQLLALPYPASADERGAALYSLQHALGGAPGPVGVPMQTDIIGSAYGTVRSMWDSAGRAVTAVEGPVEQAAYATLGPGGAIVATAKGTPTSVATGGLPPGRTSLTTMESWFAAHGGTVLLGVGALLVVNSLSGGGGRRRR
jgi:hypothetical protein